MTRYRFGTFFRILWNSFILQLKDRNLQENFMTIVLIQPVIFTLLSVGTYLFGNKPDFALYAITGSGLIGLWNNNLFTSGEIINRERRSGTLSLLFATPTPLPVILLGKSFANALFSLISVGVTFLTGKIAFHLSFEIQDPVAFIVGILLLVVALTCFGLVFGSLFILTRNAGDFIGVANYPVYILSGLAFPLTFLPWWAHSISALFATTWGNILINHAAHSSGQSMLLVYWWLIGLSFFYLIIARLLYRRVEFLALQAGVLEKW